MNTETKTDTKLTKLWILLFIVFSLWVVGGAAIWFFGSSWSIRGQFGDMFGTVNSLFAGLAFAGVIYTILLQRDELALQREELKLTRKELGRSATAQEKSEKALASQVHELQRTAKLNALSALIENYDVKIRSKPNPSDRMKLEHRQRDFIDKLEAEFTDLDLQITIT